MYTKFWTVGCYDFVALINCALEVKSACLHEWGRLSKMVNVRHVADYKYCVRSTCIHPGADPQGICRGTAELQHTHAAGFTSNTDDAVQH
jgi:hypothetical protein